ncbi:hypothetical protein HYV86_02575 [Candidatus Woesearchaeota archaeon]|nr:hypothetical protein [Candidatus Woesearchaeota archaeon]
MQPPEFTVPASTIDYFKTQVKQKIQSEGWAKQGRNTSIKEANFVRCWTTEEAFKQILIQQSVWFRYRGNYFGDANGAGADFYVKIAGKEVSLGLRSINKDSLEKYKTVAYPDDRFQHEQDKIADHHVACYEENGQVLFLGIITKLDLLANLTTSKQLYSPRNQEYFRVLPLSSFSQDTLRQFLQILDKI